MSGHPAWCVPRLCTAGPDDDGLPFADGQHRSETIRLDTAGVTWPWDPGVVSLHLTQRPCTTWSTAVFVHVHSSAYGKVATLPYETFSRLGVQVDQLVGLVDASAGGGAAVVPPPSRPRMHAAWPYGERAAVAPSA